MASGPIDSAIAVKPRMSLKRTVIGRRSPPRRHGAVLLRDFGRDVRREVPLEVGPDHRLAPQLVGVAAVPDPDRREAAERDQELKVFVAEGVGGGQVVHVQQAED